jgi:hypothetical protein
MPAVAAIIPAETADSKKSLAIRRMMKPFLYWTKHRGDSRSGITAMRDYR